MKNILVRSHVTVNNSDTLKAYSVSEILGETSQDFGNSEV